MDVSFYVQHLVLVTDKVYYVYGSGIVLSKSESWRHERYITQPFDSTVAENESTTE